MRFSGRLLLLLLAGGLLLALAGAHAKKDRSPDGGVQVRSPPSRPALSPPAPGNALPVGRLQP